MEKLASKTETKSPSKGKIMQLLAAVVIIACVIACVFGGTWIWAFKVWQTTSWDMISSNEKSLRELYTNSTQTELKALLPDIQMNFTDGLIWESHRINYTEDRPSYQNVIQVLRNGKGACGEFAWVFAAFCIANDIPVRVVTLGYFVPNVVDHSWVQINPLRDGMNWIHVEVTDTCCELQKGKTINDLWNVTINNNSYYEKYHYRMVLAFQLNQDGEIVITDVTATFSRP
jgi:hypothetical protein